MAKRDSGQTQVRWLQVDQLTPWAPRLRTFSLAPCVWQTSGSVYVFLGDSLRT